MNLITPKITPKNNVLLIHDSSDDLIESLEAAGYNIFSSNYCYQAINKNITENQIEIILIYIHEQTDETVNLIYKLKTNFLSKHLPVIVIEDTQVVTNQIAYLEEGADYYTAMPLNLLALIARIESLLRRIQWISTNNNENTQILSSLYFDLTDRQLQILRLIVMGYSNKDISEKLFISEKTTKAHINSIFKKLNAKNRTQVLINCINSGIISIK